MNYQEHKQRFALTLLFSFVVFCLMIIAIAIASGSVFILVKTGLLSIEQESMPSSFHVLIFTSILSIVTGLVVSLVSSRIPLSPINKHINCMNQLASGDFKVRLEFGGFLSKHPTFNELTHSFNTMAEELESTEMLRSDFINNFSHEFKTPIVSIAGFAKLLKRSNLTEEEKKEYLDVIEEESLRLSQMATNVMNLTKVENQSILTDISTYNISEQLRACLLLLESKWSKKHLELELDFDEHTISANEELMKEVWINLIDNAVKFSPEYSTIRLNISEHDEHLAISITNTGATIPKSKQSKIFNKFYQADESHSSEGNGIGLAIVSKIISLHSGSISVQSKSSCTTFTVQLPI